MRIARMLRPVRSLLPLRWRWAFKDLLLRHSEHSPAARRLLRLLRSREAPAAALAPWAAGECEALFARVPPPRPGCRRCVVAVDILTYSGGSRVLLNLLEALPPGVAWDFVILKTDRPAWTQQGDITALFEARGATCLDVHAPAGQMPELLTEICRRARAELLFINASRPAYGALAALRASLPSLRVVSQIHTDGPHSFTPVSIAHDIHIDAHIPIQGLIGQSLLRAGIDAAKVHVIPNGIDFDTTFNPDLHPRPPNALESPLVLWPARLHPGKRPLDFLRLMAALRGRVPGVHGLMIGDGEMLREVERAIQRRGLNGVVERRDPVRDIAPLYAQAALTVMTSQLEGMPLIVLESLGMGVPVICTEVGEVRAALRDGETGFVVPVGDHRALCESAVKLLTDAALWRRFAESARPSVAERFDRGRMARKYVELFDALVGSARP